MIKLTVPSLKTMNVHHLELFYYVARHGGIAKAVRNMPYGIQQPAVSGQIARLEEHLGVTLFQRHPFSLTPPGRKLFEFIEPFFSNLADMELEMQGGKARRLRIGASTIVLREYVPGLLRHLRKKFPQLKIGLREGHQPALESLLANDQLDLAVTVLEKKPGSGIHSLPLIELPLVLLVSKENKITSAEQLWQQDKIENPLICLPESETVCKNFQEALAKIGVDWFPGVEVSGLDLVAVYAASGLGFGLSVAIPQYDYPPQIRVIPLPKFPPIVIGALWRGKTTPAIQVCLEQIQSLASGLKCTPSPESIESRVRT